MCTFALRRLVCVLFVALAAIAPGALLAEDPPVAQWIARGGGIQYDDALAAALWQARTPTSRSGM